MVVASTDGRHGQLHTAHAHTTAPAGELKRHIFTFSINFYA
jgi:hypothetical protein